MTKVTFSARKDPLLRPRRPADEPSQTRPAALAEQSGPAQPETAGDPSGPMNDRAVEGPAGVIAVSPERPKRQRSRARSTPAKRTKTSAGSTDATPRAARPRDVTRRVQTSVSLPPETWDTLDELGEQAGVSAGELLTAVLNAHIPDTPQAALSALEQLLISISPDEGPHEERNYRLPRELRTRLDELSKALGAARMQRSMLVRAILAFHLPANGEQAHELITTRRLDAMRAALATSATR
jgi:predicted DNA-binding protein